MKNEEIAKIFYQIARFLEIDGVAFKPYAYQRAALSLESLKENVADMYRNGGKKALLQIPRPNCRLRAHAGSWDGK